MRVNVYAEEMTDRIELVEKNGFIGLRFYLELPCTLPERTDWAIDGMGNNVRGPFLHKPGDDDSAAVTFWGKRPMQPLLQRALSLLDNHYGVERQAHPLAIRLMHAHDLAAVIVIMRTKTGTTQLVSTLEFPELTHAALIDALNVSAHV